MGDDERERLARRGLEAAELLEPGKLKERVKGSVGEAAGHVALKGIAAVGRLTGRSPKRSPARARAAAEVDISAAIAGFDADDLREFEERLAEAAAKAAEKKAAEEDDGRRQDLAELRRSFPPASTELALLIFNCVDLLEELSNDAEGSPPIASELARKEDLLLRITDLLAPRAEEALRSFVEHVVATSRRYRSE
ncbi:MAG: hypothetical protein KC619_13990 [Myxococcales bacterium]|nr:hypothetical protein [Myxococcales bacterium]